MLVHIWTEERVEQLKKLWAEGATCSQIAKQMNCGLSRCAIIGKASRLKLASRMTPERRARSYRSGPVSYEEKQRREAERLARRMIAQTERRRSKVALPPLRIAESVKPPDFLALTFNEPQRESCRYPRGEGPDVRFCGQPKMHGFSYCRHCYAITHYKPNDTTPRGKTQWVDYLARAA